MNVYYTTYLARWSDKADDTKPMQVNIARMDIPETFKAWQALSFADTEIMDTEVFFFVDSPEVFERLHEKGYEEFYLIKEETNE